MTDVSSSSFDSSAAPDQNRSKWHGSHHGWDYSDLAFRWDDDLIQGPNLVCIAKEMRAWLQGQGELSVVTKQKAALPDGYTNPYSASGTTLALIFARCINSFHDYVSGDFNGRDVLDAEIERIRIYNELLIYAARFSEVSIKQLLYCTAIPQSLYKRMALGGLLTSACPICKKHNGAAPHQISFVGTVAHPYGLCFEFDFCANDHMDITNRKRNSQAAHSSVQMVDIRTVNESKEQLIREVDDLLHSFLHLLLHIENVETAIHNDLVPKGRHINTLIKGNFNKIGRQSIKVTPGRNVEVRFSSMK